MCSRINIFKNIAASPSLFECHISVGEWLIERMDCKIGLVWLLKTVCCINQLPYGEIIIWLFINIFVYLKSRVKCVWLWKLINFLWSNTCISNVGSYEFIEKITSQNCSTVGVRFILDISPIESDSANICICFSVELWLGSFDKKKLRFASHSFQQLVEYLYYGPVVSGRDNIRDLHVAFLLFQIK